MLNLSRRRRNELLTGLAFLAPNILGVMVFVIFPVVFAVVLAFTDWDLRRHNPFEDEPLRFVGFDNFVRLVTEGRFFQFLGNTLFLMMAIPFGIAGSLGAALLLSREARPGWRAGAYAVAGVVFVGSVAMLAALGMGYTGMTLLMIGVICGILVLGLAGGNTVYRTLFYMPHFVAGAATFILWKKLYNDQNGPINQALRPALDTFATGVNRVPSVLVSGWFWVGLLAMFAVLWLVWSRLRRSWSDGDVGTVPAILGGAFPVIPLVVGCTWSQTAPVWWAFVVGGGGVLAVTLARAVRGREFRPPTSGEGAGSALVLGVGAMTAMFTLLGLSVVAWNLPAMASDGLDPPDWLLDIGWAKPSLMVMGLWAAIGSNNMLLYLAALTNVPQELYEAADIDGASPLQRFWNITWPQLAPTTFFIAVMSTIGGLQGGFEMARIMTQGGPAFATTTLSYYIYIEGFQTGRLSFSAAVAWSLFLLVFIITMFNWKFGNRMVNE